MSVHQFPSSGAVPASVSSFQSPQPAPEIKPLFVTEEMVELIEGWASTAATYGELKAWGVLSQCLEWRTRT